MVNLGETIKALKSKSLEIDCTDMVLVQGGKTAKPISVRGKGYIRQEDDDRLAFKLFATDVSNTDKFAHIRAMLGPRSGTLYADTEKYSVKATAFDGTLWEADDIIPRGHWPGEGNPIFTGHMNRLTTKFRSEEQHVVRLYYFEDVDLPCIPQYDKEQQRIREKEFDVAGCRLAVMKGDNEIIINAMSALALDTSFHTRVDEALKFLTARQLQRRALVRHDGTDGTIELAALPAKSVKTRLDPPINGGCRGWFEHGWNLFSHYLEYVLNNTSHPYWNHCSYHLYNACEASANSIDAWAVGVSVAVEGLANRIPANKDDKKAMELAELRCWLLKQVSENELFKPYHERLDGLLGSMGNERVKDRLIPLIGNGHISEDYLKAWGRLRNRYVHPREVDLRNMQAGDLQQLFDLINKTTVLMYQIVFHLIGYQGPFADYGTHGYPTTDYPIAIPPTDSHQGESSLSQHSQ